MSNLPIVLVLASGKGERFLASGGKVHKLQALLKGVPLLERTLNSVRSSGLPWYVADAGYPGMGDTIAAAVSANRQSNGWLILPGDLPCIQPKTLRNVTSQLDTYAAVVPSFQGVRGHPVGFSAQCRDALIALSGAKGAASVLRSVTTHVLPVDDIGITLDVDTVSDLERCEAYF